MGAETADKPGDKSRSTASAALQQPLQSKNPQLAKQLDTAALKPEQQSDLIAGVLQGLLRGGSALGDNIATPSPIAIQQPDITAALQQLLGQGAATAGGTSVPGFQDGGTLPPGGVGVVGEAGPEVAAAAPGGGVTIAPIPIEKPNLLKTLGIILGTSLQRNPFGVAAARRANTEALAQSAITNPDLLKSPQLAGRVAQVLGDDTVQQIALSNNPDYQTLKQAEALGINLVQPGTPRAGGVAAPSLQAQLAEQAGARGIGQEISAGGQLKLTVPPLQRAQADEVKAYGLFQQAKEMLESQSVTGSAADVAAAQTVQRMARQLNMLVPDDINKLGFSRTETDIAANRTAVTENIKRQLQLNYAGATASAGAQGREVGKALGKLNAANQQVEITLPTADGPVTSMIPLSSVARSTEPITDSGKLQSWILPDGTYPPPGTTPAQLLASGAVPITKEARQAAGRLRGITDIVADMKRVRAVLFTTDDPGERAANAARYMADRLYFQQIPEVLTLATLNARLGQLVAAMGGESASRLSDADIVRMTKGFSFGLFDSMTNADTKITTIERGLGNLREGLLSGRLVGEIQASGGDPAEVARQLGIESEFNQRMSAARDRRTERDNTTKRSFTFSLGGTPAQATITER
jgi:hypothetical protein